MRVGRCSKTILTHNTKYVISSTWLLGPGCFRVIGLSESQMQTSIIKLTNESCASMVHIPSLSIVKLEPNDETILVLFNFDGNVCQTIDLSNTSLHPFRSAHSTPSKFAININLPPYEPQYMNCSVSMTLLASFCNWLVVPI